VKRLVDLFTPEARVTVLTGAGVSAESGVPTFRSAGGLWRNFRPEELATAEAFRRDPRVVWEWYAWRRSLIAACEPNEAHRVLAGWTLRFPNFRLITQNVDGLHESAFARATASTASAEASARQAVDPSGVIRLHGSIWEVSCWQRCSMSPRYWRDDNLSFKELPPPCPYCSGIIRPAVVWFGETLEPSVVSQASQAAKCDTFITIGTSAVVYPAAGFVEQAGKHGAFTVEINPEPTPATTMVDLALQGGAETILPEIDKQIGARRPVV
jgi:NAD-dependent deacetylase